MRALGASILVGAFNKDKALVGKLLHFAKLRYSSMLHLHISALCVVLCGPCLLRLVFARIISG